MELAMWALRQVTLPFQVAREMGVLDRTRNDDSAPMIAGTVTCASLHPGHHGISLAQYWRQTRFLGTFPGLQPLRVRTCDLGAYDVIS